MITFQINVAYYNEILAFYKKYYTKNNPYSTLLSCSIRNRILKVGMGNGHRCVMLAYPVICEQEGEFLMGVYDKKIKSNSTILEIQADKTQTKYVTTEITSSIPLNHDLNAPDWEKIISRKHLEKDEPLIAFNPKLLADSLSPFNEYVELNLLENRTGFKIFNKDHTKAALVAGLRERN